MKPEILISPKLGLIDEKIDIVARNLEANAPVTVSCYRCDGRYLFLGFGHFYTRSDGAVVVGEDVSYGGTYRGRLEMGLFSSMKLLPTKKTDGRFQATNGAEKMMFEVSVWKGHKTQDDIHRLHMYYEGFATMKDPPEMLRATSAFRDRYFLVADTLDLHPDQRNSELSVLLMYGEKASAFQKWQMLEARDLLKSGKMTRVVVEEIKGEGTLIDPPFTPLCQEGTQDLRNLKLKNLLIPFCRAPYDSHMHEASQVKAWNKIVEFLKTNLEGGKILAKI